MFMMQQQHSLSLQCPWLTIRLLSIPRTQRIALLRAKSALQDAENQQQRDREEAVAEEEDGRGRGEQVARHRQEAGRIQHLQRRILEVEMKAAVRELQAKVLEIKIRQVELLVLVERAHQTATLRTKEESLMQRKRALEAKISSIERELKERQEADGNETDEANDDGASTSAGTS